MQEFTLRVIELPTRWRVEVLSLASGSFPKVIEGSTAADLLSALTDCLPAIVDNCVEDFPWSAIDGRSK